LSRGAPAGGLATRRAFKGAVAHHSGRNPGGRRPSARRRTRRPWPQQRRIEPTSASSSTNARGEIASPLAAVATCALPLRRAGVDGGAAAHRVGAALDGVGLGAFAEACPRELSAGPAPRSLNSRG